MMVLYGRKLNGGFFSPDDCWQAKIFKLFMFNNVTIIKKGMQIF